MDKFRFDLAPFLEQIKSHSIHRMIRRRFILGGIYAAFLIFGLALLVFPNSGFTRFMRTSIFFAGKPLLHASRALVTIVGRDGVSTSFAEVTPFNSKILKVNLLEQENQRLRNALDFQESHQIARMRAVSVLAYSQEGGREILVVDIGDGAHIQNGDIALDENGAVVGFLEEINGHSGRIHIASNKGTLHEVELIPQKRITVARAHGARMFSLQLIPHAIPVAQGDLIMLSAEEKKIPFVLASVVRVEEEGGGAFQKVDAMLIARPELMREVFLVSPGASSHQ
ncbi:MAG: hypothetical protein G01um101466_626 [Parcubacteria group bacterium Gr01-1014_66]|nr:MAG: hypothetical protein G01um101466_626 [Parcubacteria group bacterium Gr01-1014_66]